MQELCWDYYHSTHQNCEPAGERRLLPRSTPDCCWYGADAMLHMLCPKEPQSHHPHGRKALSWHSTTAVVSAPTVKGIDAVMYARVGFGTIEQLCVALDRLLHTAGASLWPLLLACLHCVPTWQALCYVMPAKRCVVMAAGAAAGALCM